MKEKAERQVDTVSEAGESLAESCSLQGTKDIYRTKPNEKLLLNSWILVNFFLNIFLVALIIYLNILFYGMSII